VGFNVKLEKTEEATLYEEVNSGNGVPLTIEKFTVWGVDATEAFAFVWYFAERNLTGVEYTQSAQPRLVNAGFTH
jgi:hypothetical protein